MENQDTPGLSDLIVRTDQSPPVWSQQHRVQGTEDLAIDAARNTGFFSSVGTAFQYGDNWGVQIAKDIMRKGEYGAHDAEWTNERKAQFIDRNKDRISAPQNWRFMQTANETEATQLLTDSEEQDRHQLVLERRGGFGTFVARGIAGLIDVDAPLSLATGRISSAARLGLNSTKYGRMTQGALGGAAAMTGAATAGYLSSPTEDWTSIPVAGLAGAAFGVIGGRLHNRAPELHSNEPVSEAANLSRDRLLEDFGESVADGTPLAKQDIRAEPQPDADLWGAGEKRIAQEAVDGDAAMPVDDSLPAPTTAVTEVPRASTGPRVFRLQDVPPQGEYPEGFVLGSSSAGAQQLPGNGPGINSVRSARLKDIITRADDRARKTGVTDKWYDNESKFDDINPNSVLSDQAQDKMARGVKRFHDMITASPLVTDFGRMMRSGSSVAQMLAYDIFENSAGILRNNRSASMLMEHYQKELQANMLPYQDAFTEWASRTKQAGVWERTTNPKMRQEFDEALVYELQARAYDGNVARTVDPAVAKAADAIDGWSKKEIEIGQGRPGEGARLGYDKMTPESGYLPQKWDGRKIQSLVANGGHKRVVAAVAEGYLSMHPGLPNKDAQIWAQAVVDRALKTNDGLSSNLVGVLQADGRGAVEDLLKRNGVADDEVGKLIDRLTNTVEKRQRAGHTKQRIDIDMRFTASNGIRIFDLMDTDVMRIVSQRSRASAGASALARKGIYSKADWDEIVEAIIEQQKANGQSVTGTRTPGSQPSLRDRAADYIDSDKHLTKDVLDHMYSYFGSGPIAGGISPVYSRMKKLTNLAVLNQLALAQLAEFGPMIAAVGWKRFAEQAGSEIMGALRKQDSELVKELRHVNVLVPEERLFRDDLTFEYEKASNSTSEFMQKFDNVLNKAGRIQGYTSGFYAVRNIQQRIAVTSAADRIMREIRDGMQGNVMSMDRLVDAGFDKNLLSRIRKHTVQTGKKKKKPVVQFDNDGSLVKLNMDKWPAKDAEDFALVLNRITHQQVQKAMAGESSVLFHKDGIASLFYHLKAFPMQALEKQAYRSVRMADQEAQAAFMYGLITAGAAYTVKQSINGRSDNLTAQKIALGAFGMSNLTGWIPMWVDPLAGMFGLDSLRFNQYAPSGQASIFGSFPAYETVNRMLGLPGATLHAVTGNLSASDVRSFQAIPLIGNAYGFTYMFNQMKEYAKENQKTIRKEVREKAKDKQAVQELIGPF